MKFKLFAVGLTLFAVGCADRGPTSPEMEQAVFTALGGLRVGETMDLAGAAAAEVLLGGSGPDGEYLFIPFHASTGTGDLRVTVGGESVSAALAVEPLSPRGDSRLRLDPRALASDEAHYDLHTRLQARVAPLLHAAQGSRLRPRTLALSNLSEMEVRVGEEVQINASATGDVCSAEDMRTGRIEAVTQHAIVVGDVGNPSGGFTPEDYAHFGNQIDNLVYPTLVNAFGEPTDIDQNGRIVVFFTRAVNELTAPGEGSFVAGFFYGRDILPVETCAASNGGEIFYILAPDPNREASHLQHLRADVLESAVGTIGHELQHLINFSRRVWINSASETEETWLDEALSHVAEELLFYAQSGVSPRSNFGETDLTTQGRVDAINRFGVQNLARFGIYLENVTTNSATEPSPSVSLETRGAAWAFLRYLLDHAPQGDDQLLHGLVNSQTAGFENLEAVFARDPMDALQMWGVSIFTDDYLRLPEAEYLQQPSWNFRSLLPVLFQRFPLDVASAGEGDTTFDLKAGTSGYLRFRPTAGAIARLHTTAGADQTPSDVLRVTVIRTR